MHLQIENYYNDIEYEKDTEILNIQNITLFRNFDLTYYLNLIKKYYSMIHLFTIII